MHHEQPALWLSVDNVIAAHMHHAIPVVPADHQQPKPRPILDLYVYSWIFEPTENCMDPSAVAAKRAVRHGRRLVFAMA